MKPVTSDADVRTVRLGAPHIVAAGLCALGMTAVVLMTTWGVGTSPDSVHYIRAARTILGTEPATSVAVDTTLVHFSPLYPALLATAGMLGVEPLDAARWLNVGLLGLNIFLVGFLVRRTSTQLPWIWAAGALLMAGALPVVSVHATALSEPLFLFLSLLGFLLLAGYLERERGWLFISASAALALALLARYAGAACVLTAVLAILLFGPGSIARRIRLSLAFGVLSGTPMTIWMLRNLLFGGEATGRELSFHPLGRAEIWQALYTISGWLLVPAATPGMVRALVVLGCVGGFLLLVKHALAAGRETPRVIVVLALFVGVYASFLAASISLMDANTPLDDRILLPVFASGIVLAAYGIDRAWMSLRPGRASAVGLVCVLLLFVSVHMVRGAAVVSTGHADGWGFFSRAWRHSGTLARVRGLDPGAIIYSNAPEIIYLHTKRDVRSVPRFRLLMNRQPNQGFARELAQVRSESLARCTALVYFRNLPHQKAVPSEGQLRAALPLQVRAEERDGIILTSNACRP